VSFGNSYRSVRPYRRACRAHILLKSSWSSHSIDELAELTFCRRARRAHILLL